MILPETRRFLGKFCWNWFPGVGPMVPKPDQYRLFVVVLSTRVAAPAVTEVFGPGSNTEFSALKASPRSEKLTRSVTLKLFCSEKSRLGTVGLRTEVITLGYVL